MSDLPFEDAVRRQFDVERVEGDELICRCKWHDDTGRPNLSVNGETGLYHCWVCGASGKIGGLTAEEELLALKAKLRAVENPPPQEIEAKPESWLLQFSQHNYWRRARGFHQRTVDRFDLGYDPATNRLTIPIRTVDGRLLGAIYRAMDGSKPKYLHPKGFRTGNHLYAAHMVKDRRQVALVEGPLDAVACWNARVPALAVYGARLTEGQAHLLRLLGVDTVVPMFDRDAAGREAEHRIREHIPDLIIRRTGEWPVSYAKDPGDLRPGDIRRVWRQAGGVAGPDR